MFFAALLGMFISVPSAINQLNEIEQFDWVNDIAIIGVVLLVALMPVFNLNGTVVKVLFVAAYSVLVIGAVVTQMYSEGFVLLTFLFMLWALPQQMIVFSFLIGALFLVVLINVRYSYVTISYQSAISTFALMSILFIGRY